MADDKKKETTNGQPRVARANPSKAFFIDMLTRDISTSECIMDLIDNSINSLITKKDMDVMQHVFDGTKAPKINAKIHIAFSATTFSITDTCGGITITEAEEDTFLLGNPTEEKNHSGLGVYGIGMKRAFFKIGKKIKVNSHTTDEEFQIDISVDSWKNDPENWTFPFTHAGRKKSPAGGTTIEVIALNPVVSQQFGGTALKTLLIEKIATAYALFIRAGLEIKVNEERVKDDLPELSGSKDLSVVRQLRKKDQVDILIMAGVTTRADRTPRGWYIFCNGRMVLNADKSEKTGWGLDNVPMFHSKFNHFLGFVFFRSKDVRKLPWTTTKEGVQRESPVYQAALAEMRILNRPVLNFLNNLYPDVREENEPERDILDKAKPIDTQKAASGANSIFEARVKKTSDDDLVSIQYKRPKKKIKRVKEALEMPGLSNSRVGEETFDRFYERHC